MTDLLDETLTPWERMAEIRRLVRETAALAEEAGRAQVAADEAAEGSPAMWFHLDRSDAAWKEHDALVTDLLEHLNRAEARGELGECEGMLSISYAGRA